MDTQQSYTPANFSVGSPFGYGGYGGGFGLPPVGLFGILGGRGFGMDGHDHHHHDRHCDDDIGKFFLLQSLLDKSDNHARDLGDIKKEIAERVGDARSSLQSEICETKSKIFETGARIIDKMTGEFRDVQEDLCNIRRELLENKYQFGIAIEKSKQEVLDKLCMNREADLRDEIDRLRHERHDFSFNSQFNALFSELQNQRQSNKVVQFGAGNVADAKNKQQQVG